MPDDATTAVAATLTSAAPPGWAWIRLTVSATVMAYEYALELRLADGRNSTMDIPGAVKAGFRELRGAMYEPGRGTWFSAVLEAHAGAEPVFSFNFDEDPNWWPPLHPTAFTRDLETFPRDDAHIPPWLRDMLAEGSRLEGERAEP